MIFSRTAKETDLVELKVQENLINYLQHPNSIDNYTTSIFKFWEYSLLLNLIDFYNLKNEYILNVVIDKNDNTLNDLANIHGLKLNQITYSRFLKLPVKVNRYGIVCAFGIIEHASNEYQLIDKLSKHVNIDGHIILTTDNTETSKLRTVDIDDFASISFFLEKLGYDFCSDEQDLVDYSNKSKLHSLVMKRIGN